MGRSGYVDDFDENWTLIRWRGAVKSALRGRRGQAFLRELLAALDALPEKKLIRHELADEYDASCVCTLGAVGRTRGLDMSAVDPDDHENVAAFFNLPHALACEIMWLNDDLFWRESAEVRWSRMRDWVSKNIIPT